MSKLPTQGSNQNRPFQPKIYQGRRRGQGRNNYYDRVGNGIGLDQVAVIDIEDKIYRDRPQYGHNRERSQCGQNYRGNLR